MFAATDRHTLDRPQPARSVRAFTLIEILVVIVIIAILIGVLIPVLGFAKKAGKKTVCQSNLGQIGKAFDMYTTDHKTAYPYQLPPKFYAAPPDPTP